MVGWTRPLHQTFPYSLARGTFGFPRVSKPVRFGELQTLVLRVILFFLTGLGVKKMHFFGATGMQQTQVRRIKLVPGRIPDGVPFPAPSPREKKRHTNPTSHATHQNWCHSIPPCTMQQQPPWPNSFALSQSASPSCYPLSEAVYLIARVQPSPFSGEGGAWGFVGVVPLHNFVRYHT